MNESTVCVKSYLFLYFVLLNVVLMSDICIVIVEYSSIYVVYRLIDTSVIKS